MPEARTQAELDGLTELLQLPPGARLLDGPCGYGRTARPLAERGFRVLGVDQSAPLLAAAERARGELSTAQLRYVRQDLREPLASALVDDGFDAALCLFSSLGYGTEADDLAIVGNLARALKPGGKLLVDTHHRDSTAAMTAHGGPPAVRLADGTILIEQPRFDAIAGRIDTTWYWQGPHGGGEKSASIRIYTLGEWIAILERAGLRFVSAQSGCSTKPYVAEGKFLGGRVGLVAERPV